MFLRKKKTNKFRNQKHDGFDSRKEAKRAAELQLLLKAGIISDLEFQKEFVLLDGFRDKWGIAEKSIKYYADFSYFDKEINCWVVEDVKSEITKNLPDYAIKRKLMKAKYPNIKFVEIGISRKRKVKNAKNQKTGQ